MDVDRNAPAVAHAEADVAAPPEAVWELVAGIERWPAWNPDVKSAALQGDLAPGSTFRWKAGPGRLSRRSRTSTRRGRSRGPEGRWASPRSTSTGSSRAGGTHVVSEESWAGLPVRLLRARMAKTLQTSLEEGLAHLKAAAERSSP